MHAALRSPSFIVVLFLTVAANVAAHAQTATPPTETKRLPAKYGSPLDTLMTTHLWTDVPPTQDFVKETHPDPKSLDYTPLTGKDPNRPKPRDATGIQALRAELEQDASRNSQRAKGFADPSAPAPRRTKKVAKAKAHPSVE